jgi:hypothetical protein
MFFMRGSRTALDKLLHPDAIETPEESILSAKVCPSSPFSCPLLMNDTAGILDAPRFEESSI